MDSPFTPPIPSQPPAPQPAANLNTPELPRAPEKLLPTATSAARAGLTPPPARAEHAGGHKTSWGAALGIVIIILVLIVGALYFWGAKLVEEQGGLVPEATQN